MVKSAFSATRFCPLAIHTAAGGGPPARRRRPHRPTAC